MKKNVFLSSIAILAMILTNTNAEDTNSSKTNFSENTFKMVEERMVNIEKAIKDKNSQPAQPTLALPSGMSGGKKDFDVKDLPVVQGTMVIKKDGKTVVSEALVTDGGVEMYLNTKNSKLIKGIGSDYVDYNANGVTTRTPIVNNKTTAKTDVLKTDINEFSSLQAPTQAPKKLPSFEEMIKNTSTTN